MIANALPSGVDEAVIVLNAALAGSACGFNAVVAVRSGHVGRVLHTMIAVLAAGYCAAYVALLASGVTVGQWSSVMRGVSLVAWAVVWCGPAIIRLRSNIPQRFADEIGRRIEQIDLP